MPIDSDLKGYERGLSQICEGIDCRALWLSVIQQAILDSQKAQKEHKKDLPQVIKSQWWSQIFNFAGVENMREIVTQQITKNLNAPPQKKEHKRRYTHCTTSPQSI